MELKDSHDLSGVIKVAAGIAVIAIAVVVWQGQSEASAEGFWTELSRPDVTVDELEELRAKSLGSDLEPWAAYSLASRLYDEGDLQRARQIAEESGAGHPNHACAPWLAKLAAAAGTYPAGS